MKIGIIAGNRLFPVLLAQTIKQNFKDSYICAICFKGETLPALSRYVDKTHWMPVGQLDSLRTLIIKEAIDDWVMAGQISPYRLFQKNKWDKALTTLVESLQDTRPHTIFSAIIGHLEHEGVKLIDSTMYVRDHLAGLGTMNKSAINEDYKKDVAFGTKLISGFVELDVGQTIVVKEKSAVAVESLEGTDATIARGYKIAGAHCTVLKFSKHNQDLRFDVPIVGLKTLQLLKRIRAAALVLEKGKVIILEKEKFLHFADRANIPIIGEEKIYAYQRPH